MSKMNLKGKSNLL